MYTVTSRTILLILQQGVNLLILSPFLFINALQVSIITLTPHVQQEIVTFYQREHNEDKRTGNVIEMVR